MIKTPMRFSASDCGCGSPPVTVPCRSVISTLNCASICDDRFYQLALAGNLQLLGIGNGGNCQLKLAPNESGGAFVWIDGNGLAYANRSPALRLPFVNVPTSGVYPSSGTFPVLMGSASGAADESWNFIHAPSSGEYLILADNGLFRFIDAGEIPGLTTVCENASGATLINLFGCYNSTPEEVEPTWILKKLTPIDGRVVTGYVPGDGESGFRELPADQYLTHPIGRIFGLECTALKIIDSSGNPQEFGVQNPAVVTDQNLVVQSPTTGLVSDAPARYAHSKAYNVTVNIPDNADYQALGGHAILEDIQINYPKLLVSVVIKVSTTTSPATVASFKANAQLYVDGAAVQEFIVKGAATISITWLLESLSIGTHTIEFRLDPKDDVPGDMSVTHSYITAVSIP